MIRKSTTVCEISPSLALETQVPMAGRPVNVCARVAIAAALAASLGGDTAAAVFQVIKYALIVLHADDNGQGALLQLWEVCQACVIAHQPFMYVIARPLCAEAVVGTFSTWLVHSHTQTQRS